MERDLQFPQMRGMESQTSLHSTAALASSEDREITSPILREDGTENDAKMEEKVPLQQRPISDAKQSKKATLDDVLSSGRPLGDGTSDSEKNSPDKGDFKKDSEESSMVLKSDEEAIKLAQDAPPLDLSQLSFVLAELKLVIVYIERWALIQRADFDLTLEDEPYHNLQGRRRLPKSC
jgi:hypothetical protein